MANVPFGDTLNVRKYPSSTSQKQAAYPNGTVLQMTGRCTGGINLLDIANQPDWKQEQTVRYRWCEVWHDPAQNGNFVTGWVYGRYGPKRIAPLGRHLGHVFDDEPAADVSALSHQRRGAALQAGVRFQTRPEQVDAARPIPATGSCRGEQHSAAACTPRASLVTRGSSV